MDQIGKRLRNLNACDPECEGRCRECPNALMREAADTIDRLTVQIRHLEADRDQAHNEINYLHAQLASARREAMEEAAKIAHEVYEEHRAYAESIAPHFIHLGHPQIACARIEQLIIERSLSPTEDK